MAYDWSEILEWFEEDPSKIEEPDEIIYAEYGTEGYEGQADVLFWDLGKFWYVSGSHCSCYGLEDQWNPEEYTPETLKGQIERASYGFFKDQKELIMATIEKFSSPLGELAARYAAVETKLSQVDQEWQVLTQKRNELTKEKEQLKTQLRKQLD